VNVRGKIQPQGQAGNAERIDASSSRGRLGRGLFAANQRAMSNGWMTGAWFLRDDDTLGSPGDSPMGLSRRSTLSRGFSEKDFRGDANGPSDPRSGVPKGFPYASALSLARRPRLPGEGRGQRAKKIGEREKPRSLEIAADEDRRTDLARARARRGSSHRPDAFSAATDVCTFCIRRRDDEEYLDLMRGLIVVTEMGTPGSSRRDTARIRA